jgi:hypothetical protein
MLANNDDVYCKYVETYFLHLNSISKSNILEGQLKGSQAPWERRNKYGTDLGDAYKLSSYQRRKREILEQGRVG